LLQILSFWFSFYKCWCASRWHLIFNSLHLISDSLQHLISNSLQHHASDQPTTLNTSVADYADDKVLISINNDPIIASINPQTHLDAMEKWFKKWRFKVNQNLYPQAYPLSWCCAIRHSNSLLSKNQIPWPYSGSKINVGSSHQK